MQTVVFKCDRCGAPATNDTDRSDWVYIELREHGALSQLDLCPLCKNAIKRELRPKQAS